MDVLRRGLSPSDAFHCIVVDELHILDEGQRGTTLELLLTKLAFFQRKHPAEGQVPPCAASREQRLRDLREHWAADAEGVTAEHADREVSPATLSGSPGSSVPPPPLQLIGMSATLPNAAALSDWLGTGLYTCSARPVPLRQYIQVG